MKEVPYQIHVAGEIYSTSYRWQKKWVHLKTVAGGVGSPSYIKVAGTEDKEGVLNIGFSLYVYSSQR